jgi:hypothetical protein
VALEEVGEVLEGLVPRRLLRGRRVDGDAQDDVALAGMAGVAPGLPVGGDVQPQLGDVVIAQPDEQRQPQAGVL